MSSKEKEFDLNMEGINFRIFRTEEYENRPLLVFLHESLGCIAHWKDFPSRLGKAARCNILVYDRQGYGKSDPFSINKRDKNYLETEAHVLIKILDALSVHRAILFGHSDGGSIALLTASLYQKRIQGIIAEGAHVRVEEVTLEGVRNAVTVYETTNLQNKLKKYHGNKTEQVFNMWAEIWLDKGFRDWTIEESLSEIQCPVLCIQGEKDEYATLEHVEWIIDRITGETEKWMVENTGHTPHREIPEEVISRCVRFIDSLENIK